MRILIASQIFGPEDLFRSVVEAQILEQILVYPNSHVVKNEYGKIFLKSK